MGRTVTIDLKKSDREALAALEAFTGFEPEAAALYAIRLVGACLREGLLTDETESAWPKEVLMTGAGGKVIAFPVQAAEKKTKDEASV